MIGRRALLAALCGAAGAGASPATLWAHDHSAAPKPAPDPLSTRFGGPFALIDHNGAAVTDKSYRGRFMLIYFGFTRCEDTCPIDVPILVGALDALGALGEKVVPLFITVDPAHDVPAVLKPYVEGFHPRLVGLTGSESAIAAVARAYRVHRLKVTRAGDAKPSHTISHGSLTFLMDPDGGFRTLVPHNTPVDRLAELLRKYVSAQG